MEWENLLSTEWKFDGHTDNGNIMPMWIPAKAIQKYIRFNPFQHTELSDASAAEFLLLPKCLPLVYGDYLSHFANMSSAADFCMWERIKQIFTSQNAYVTLKPYVVGTQKIIVLVRQLF